MTNRKNILIVCSPEDERHRSEVLKHLKPLPDVVVLHHGQIPAGDDIDNVMRKMVDEADIILLLLSPDLLSSDHASTIEVHLAVGRGAKNSARIVPVRVRAIDTSDTSFARLQSLPYGGPPIAESADRDRAWMDVVKELRRFIRDDAPNPAPAEDSSPLLDLTAAPVGSTIQPIVPNVETLPDEAHGTADVAPLDIVVASKAPLREPCIRRVFAVEITSPEPVNQDLEWVGAYLFCEARSIGIDRRCILLLRTLRAIVQIQRFRSPDHPRSDWTETDRLLEATANVLAEYEYDLGLLHKDAEQAMRIARTGHFLQFQDVDNWGRVERVMLSNIGDKLLKKSDPWNT